MSSGVGGGGGALVGGSFALGAMIGTGSYGNIFKGTSVTSGDAVAIKIDHFTKTDKTALPLEASVYRLLQGEPGVPTLRWSGTHGADFVLVMDLLGSSLEELMQRQRARCFSLKTVLQLADQMISRVQSVHACGYLHRDMKPDNFLMGLGPQAATVFLVDFGLAKRFLHPRSRRHVPARDGKRLSGTPRYCSLANHAGLETARRDDMEALGYVLLYLARGSLPWQGLKRSCRKDNFIAIAKCKMQLPLEALCAGLPSAFGAYLRYCRELAYDTEPEYAALRLLFTSAATEAGFAYDGVFDWSRAPCK